MTDNRIRFSLETNAAEFRRQMREGVGEVGRSLRGARTAATTETQRIRGAMRQLGVRPFGDIDREIVGLRQSYRTLARSGKVSSQELALAHNNMERGIRELQARKSGWNRSIREARNGLIALTAAGAGFIAFLGSAAREASTFQTAMAEVSTLVEASPQQMAALTEEVRRLAVEMGTNAPTAARALYQIISAGVQDLEQAPRVLEQATRAGIAGLVETDVAAQVGLAAINAYGLGVESLDDVYDTLFATVRAGVTTMGELSNSLGRVLPIAAAAEVPLSEVAGAVAALTQGGLNTAEAVTSLRGAITGLQTPTQQAAERMAELGIEWDGLAGTLRQIAESDLSAEAIRDIVPDTRARTAVLALTRDVDALEETMRGVADAGGSMNRAYELMEDTPEQRMRQFRASLNDLRLSLGNTVTALMPVVDSLTTLVQAFGRLPEPLQALALTTIPAVIVAKVAWAGAIRPIVGLLAATRGASVALNVALRALPWVALAAAVGKFVAEGVRAVQTWRTLRDNTREYLRTQREIQEQNREFANAEIRSARDVAAAGRREVESYRQRLEAARDFHRARRDELSTEAAESDPLGEIPEEAMRAARSARQYQEALTALEDYFSEREGAERQHARTLKDIKQAEREDIERELARQIDAYEAANRGVKEARRERERIEQEFDDWLERIRREDAGDREITFLDVSRLRSQAREALQGGEFERAIELAREAASAAEELREQGFEGLGMPMVDAGLADDIAAIAREAARAREEAAEAEAAAVSETIQGLIRDAQWLQEIEVGFDQEGADLNADELRERLQQRLQENPLRYPVELTLGEQALDTTQARELLEGLPRFHGGGELRGSGEVPFVGLGGEGVLNRAAMNFVGGAEGLSALNRLQVPETLSGDRRAGNAGGNPVHLHLDGREYVTSASNDAAAGLSRAFRRQALKTGRRG